MESKIKHLEMVQSLISKFSANIFILRGWCITLTSGLLVASISSNAVGIAPIVLVPVFVFWVLDAYHKSRERRFMSLYDEIRLKDKSKIDFSMNTKAYKGGKNSFGSSFFSMVAICFYGFQIILCLAVFLLGGKY